MEQQQESVLNLINFSKLVVTTRPYAVAHITGNDQYPNISGTVYFYPVNPGCLIVAEIFHLPYQDAGPFYGFHLHDGIDCGSGAGDSPFSASGSHYNPSNMQHPFHAGDFPALLGNDGYTYISFYTSRFSANEAIGKTVVIHQHSDDFHSQPSGNSGTKLACGKVVGSSSL